MVLCGVAFWAGHSGEEPRGSHFQRAGGGRKMATPLGWSQGGSGSVCLAFDQLRDVIESQEELIHQLRNVVRGRESAERGCPEAAGGGQS